MSLHLIDQPVIIFTRLITAEERPKVYFPSYIETEIMSVSEAHVLSSFPVNF